MCRGDRDNGSESARCGGDNRSQPQEHGVTARSVRPPKAAVRVCHGQLPVSCPAGEGEVGWLLVPGTVPDAILDQRRKAGSPESSIPAHLPVFLLLFLSSSALLQK